MKVLHVSTFERAGGAAIAASRLHLGLRARGVDSTLLVRDTTPDDPVPKTLHLDESTCGTMGDPRLLAVLYTTYERGLRPGVDRRFSTDLPTRALSTHPAVMAADIVNVHWVADLMSVPALRAVQDVGTPVVWTLHDQAAFTGGCHYSGPCRGFELACEACPDLRAEAQHVPGLVLRHKRRWIDPARLTVVCPSEWLAGLARRSALLDGATVETIPNGVPVAVYQRPRREAARAALGLPPDAVVLLAGAERLDERRKGTQHLREVLSRLAADPRLRPGFETGRILCAVFGAGTVDDGMPVRSLGRLRGEEQIALAYRAADVFVLPTLEDNLPNTLLESLAAGTPVVAYATGGVPEIIQRGSGGLVVPSGDTGALAAALRLLILDPGARERLSNDGAQYARTALDVSVQSEAYVRLYARLLGGAKPIRLARLPQPAREDTAHRLAASEAELMAGVLESEPMTAWLVRQLAADVGSHRSLIAARGGEIAALRSDLQIAHDERQVTRDALRQAEERLSALSAAYARARGVGSALHRRLKRLMTKVVILGSGDRAGRLWEALTFAGADVLAFVDTDPRRHGRPFLGADVQPPSWLATACFDLLAVPDADMGEPSIRALVESAGSRAVALPADDAAALVRAVAARLPDPWAGSAGHPPARAGLRVGIFGTGSAAMKVWEALSEIDEADAVWFADNNPAQQGRPLLWLNVIAPSDIPTRSADAIVIGSMSRDAIHGQLVALGVPAGRILTPDVVAGVDDIRAELRQALERPARDEVLQ
jgi:glycosyltransferase involved in cell wall biosynthesis